MPLPDEITAAHKALAKELRKLRDLFDDAAKPKLKDADFAKQLDSAVGKIPAGHDLAVAVDELRERARRLAEDVKLRRQADFGAIVAAFIRDAQSQGKLVRESSSSWRVGKVELDLQPDQSRARVRYNQEVVLPWRGCSDASDLAKLEKEGGDLLAKRELTDTLLVATVAAAYKEAVGRHADGRVPAREFLEEFRLALVRDELRRGKPGVKLKTSDFPLWALFYNLDRYRALGDKIPPDLHITFETGDQQVVAQRLNIRLGGLRADNDYQVFSFVTRRRLTRG